jgi:hypothetical protein
LTGLLAKVLAEFVPTPECLDPDASYLVDGTLVPCWSWTGRRELFSGKHKTTGMNLQVACDLSGRLAWVSDPMPGSVHDVKALDASAVLDSLDPSLWVGDKGYIGRGMLTPRRKPPTASLTDHDKAFNHQINSTRAPIERAIAHLKTWKTLHTDYRRPIHTLPTTISAILGIIFWKHT